MSLIHAHTKDTPVLNKKVVSHGLPITIEHAQGSKRELYDDAGKLVYSKTMYFPYGFFGGTAGRDGDDVDVFLGPLKDAKEIFIVHMKDLGPDRAAREDEDKVFLGWRSANDAKAAFLMHYPSSFFGGMTVLPLAEFKKKLKTASLKYHERKIHAHG